MNYIEEDRLNELGQFLSDDKLYTLLSRYVDDCRQIIRDLHDAIGANDCDTAQRNAHSLKSTSANVGAIPLSELALQLENLGREKRLPDIAAQMEKLEAVFAQTHAAVNNLAITAHQRIE